MSNQETIQSKHQTLGEASGECHRLNGYFMNSNYRYIYREGTDGMYEVVKVEKKKDRKPLKGECFRNELCNYRSRP